MRLTYNQFRSKHKGTPSKEISALWKRYKANDYDLPPELLDGVEAPVETTEVKREEAEMEIVKATTTAKEESGSMSRAILSYLSTRLA